MCCVFYDLHRWQTSRGKKGGGGAVFRVRRRETGETEGRWEADLCRFNRLHFMAISPVFTG